MSMIVTTTHSIEGKSIQSYHGVVVGDAIFGTHEDMFVAITEIVRGPSGALETSLAEARRAALNELEERANQSGGNAVVGVTLDYEIVNKMLMVSASGTAVTVV